MITDETRQATVDFNAFLQEKPVDAIGALAYAMTEEQRDEAAALGESISKICVGHKRAAIILASMIMAHLTYQDFLLSGASPATDFIN